MAGSRFDAKINEAIVLNGGFTSDKDNIYYDPAEIDRIEIIDSATGTILQTIDGSLAVKVLNPSGQLVGKYKITTSATWNTVPRAIIDKWYSKIEADSSLLPQTGSCTIRDADGVAAAVADCRKGFAFNNPDLVSNNNWGAIITPDELRYVFGFGQDFVAPNSHTITDDTLKWYVDNAVGNVEQDLKVTMTKKIIKYIDNEDARDLDEFGEEGIDYFSENGYDFNRDQFQRYMYLKLRRRPIISVESAVWKDVTGDNITDILPWMRLNKKRGSVQFFPNAGDFSALPVYLGQTFALERFMAGSRYYPDAFFFDYTVGFKTVRHLKALYPELFTIVGKLAAINMLADYGDGKSAAIASSSISLSGISESFSTTQSASIGGEIRIPVGEEIYRIDNMFKNKDRFIGKEVLSVHPISGKPEYKKILDVIEHDTKNKQCYKLTFDNNTIFTITEDHSMFTKRTHEGIREIKGDDLFIGLHIVFSNHFKIYTRKIVEIEKINRDKMYDLSIEDNENFVCEHNILTHNTSATFGARILQYKNDLALFYKNNRNKYCGILLAAL